MKKNILSQTLYALTLCTLLSTSNTHTATYSGESFGIELFAETIQQQKKLLEQQQNNYEQTKRSPQAQAAALRTPTDNEKAFLAFAMSFREFMEHALHDSDWGFYGAGRVSFIPGNDFWTYPKVMRPSFGASLAYQAYGMGCSMLLNKDITSDETFHIVEFGAGDGDLGFDIMSSILQNAQQEILHKHPTMWQQFYNNVSYIIGERSPVLRVRQEATNKMFIDENKFKVVAADARDSNFLNGKKIKGLILSNELLDTFCVHRAVFDQDNKLNIGMVLPIIDTSKWEQDHLASPKILKVKSDVYRDIYKDFVGNIALNNNEALLSKDDYLMLKKSVGLKNQQQVDTCVRFAQCTVDAALFPEISDYLSRHHDIMRHYHTNEVDHRKKCCYINHTVADFVRSAAHILDKGFMLTIDYGATSMVHAWQFSPSGTGMRLFPNGYLFDAPGSADITTDVNFTDMHLVGQEAGFELVFYGGQNALEKVPLAVSNDLALEPFDLENKVFGPVMSEAHIERFRSVADSVSFRMLIQRKGCPGNGFKVLKVSDPIFEI